MSGGQNFLDAYALNEHGFACVVLKMGLGGPEGTYDGVAHIAAAIDGGFERRVADKRDKGVLDDVGRPFCFCSPCKVLRSRGSSGGFVRAGFKALALLVNVLDECLSVFFILPLLLGQQSCFLIPRNLK